MKVAADEAATAAAAGKAAMRAEVEKGIAAVETGWAELEKQAKAAARKLKPEQRQAWTDDAKAVQDALQAAKDSLATAPADAKAKLVEVAGTMEKWTKDLAQATAAPARPAKVTAPARKAAAKPSAKK